jgi:glycerol uptake facilitator protein
MHECGAELIGTFILVFLGVGSVHVAVLTGALQGLWQVAVVWALSVSLAIYATAALSGAHINPAITLAFAVYRRFSWRKVVPYIAAQLVGAFTAAATLNALFAGLLSRFERARQIVRGQPGSELSAMVYGNCFPNPAVIGVTPEAIMSVSVTQAMLAEGIGTAFLVFFVFSLTEVRNPDRPEGGLVPAFIGLGAAAIICVVAPLTQAGLNPARDFGPRLFAWLAGWGSVAIPGPRGGFFTVYILAPLLGALVGAAVYQFVLRPRTGALTPPKE